MKEHLDGIINKDDEKLFFNYIQFARALFKTNKSNNLQLLLPNEFFEQVLKQLFEIHDNSLRTLNYGLEVNFYNFYFII
jgi:hypothetical protein